tara:strand:+ start:3983 stop:4756 length:774 start_codon:yes stop_codon:yes gene_type:complete
MKKIILSVLIILNFSSLKAETEIKYSAYLGGFQVANILYSAELNQDDWKIKTTITASGLVDVFVSFVFFAESNGKYVNKNLVSDSYNFSYEIKNKNKSRVAEIKYNEGLPISVTAEPPYRGKDIPTEEFLKKYGENASDPNSVFVVSNKFTNPCLENSKSFDGIRSYEIKMSKRSKSSKLTIDNKEYETIICRGSFNAIIGYNNSDFLETASEENAITYWYSFFKKEKMWIPIKFTIDTPLGALVIKAKEIKNNYIG